MEASMKITRLGIVLVLMTVASANAFARGGGAAGHGGGGMARGGLPLLLPSTPALPSQALTGPSGPPALSIVPRSPAAAAGNLYPNQFNSFRH
jgi:hypothetical protein